MLIVLGAGSAILASLVVAWFYVLESNDRRHTIFVVVALSFILEAIATPEAASVPTGVLRPELLGQDFRPPDLFLFAALAARLLAGRWGRIGPVGLAWFPFFAIYFTGVVIGLLIGLDFAQVLFQGKALLYVVGGLVVASGVDVNRVNDSIGRVGLVLAPLVPVALIMTLTGTTIAVDTPLQSFPSLGQFSHDTVTLLVVIGGAVIITEAVRARPRWYVAASGVILLMVPITREQRGSYLTLAAVVVALLLLATGKTWRRRSSVIGVQVGMIVATLLAVGAVGLVAGAPSASLEETFGGQGKKESARERVLLYEQAIEMAEQRPILGSGVGIQVGIQRVNTGEQLDTTAHNLVLDIWLRVGLVGAAFMAIALGATVWTAISVWRGSATNPVAAVAIVGLLGVLGWLAKALVEPALDKFRLSLLLGLALGFVAASWRSDDKAESEGEVSGGARVRSMSGAVGGVVVARES
jgi:O-antigen ligase